MTSSTSIIVLASGLACLTVWGALGGMFALNDAVKGGPWLATATLAAVLFTPTLAIAAAPDVFRANVGRDLYEAEAALSVLRGITAGLTGLAAVAAAAALVGRRPAPPAPVVILLAYLLYLPLITLAVGVFDPRQLLLPGLVLAATTCWATPRDQIYRLAGVLLRIMVVGSAALAVVAPSLAFLERFLESTRFFGIPQLAGLTTHPNVLGPLAALALLVELARPPWRRRLPWLVLDIVVLVWSGSRTGWLCALAVLAVVVVRENVRERIPALLAIIGATVGVLVTSGSTSIFSLTGRNEAWAIATSMLGESPVVGNGIGSYLAAASARDLGWANTAHNQVLHSLAEGGLIGGLLVVGFLLAAFRWAVRSWRDGEWVPMGLVAAFTANSVGETPIGQHGLITLMVMVMCARPTPEPGSRRTTAERTEVDPLDRGGREALLTAR